MRLIKLDCGADPEICIDWLALAIGNFLKDWVTMSCLALLLLVLLRIRRRQQQARYQAYTAGLLKNSETLFDPGAQSWIVESHDPQPGRSDESEFK